MKVTDYCPRAAPFDTYLREIELRPSSGSLVGVEVGVDVGAHAEALLTYCPVALLHLVDPWPNIERRGYCDGRLSRFRGRYELHRARSLDAVGLFVAQSLDFVYLDQEHDEQAVSADLLAWYPRVRDGGLIGHRNYVEGRGAPLDKAIEKFVAKNKLKTAIERYGNDIVIFKP